MAPVIWLILVAVLLVIEAATTALTTIWFAGGALVAAIAAWFHAGFVTQLILFFAVSVVLLIFTRPLAVRYMNRGVTKTNVESLIGCTAVVTEEIGNLSQTGQVQINDIDWLARAKDNDCTIPKGAVVRILEVHGVKLIVEEIKEG